MKNFFFLFSFLFVFLNSMAQNALNFDGTDDIVVTTYSGIGGNAARTVEAWIRTTAVSDPNQGGSQKTILDWGSMSPNGSRFTFNMTWGNSIRIEVGGNGISGTLAVNDGNWHHLAVSYDPILTTNQFKLYIDGVLHVEGNTTVAVNTNTSTGLPVQIGRRVDGINGFNGDIDEVRIWNVARSGAEIAGNMNSEFCELPVGLVAYFRANQGTALGNNTGLTNMIEEVSGNNGTLQNFALLGATSNWVTGSGISNGSVQGPNITATSCGPYTAPSGTIITTTGQYQDTLMSADGCDSLIALDITVNNVDVAVSTSGTILTANQTGATYQWLVCPAFTSIAGANGQFFIATQNGDYAVAVTKDGCTDTSACYTIQGIGFQEEGPFRFSLYPNPTNGAFIIQCSDLVSEMNVEILDLSGRGVFRTTAGSTNQIEVEAELPGGAYFVKVESEYGSQISRLLIQ